MGDIWRGKKGDSDMERPFELFITSEEGIALIRHSVLYVSHVNYVTQSVTYLCDSTRLCDLLHMYLASSLHNARIAHRTLNVSAEHICLRTQSPKDFNCTA